MSSILSEDRFSALLQRERLRTHRNGFTFSLLVFRGTQQALEISAFETLSRYLRGRLRSVDDIGWYGEKAIGVLLPDTGSAGAELLSNEIMENTDPNAFFIEIQVYPMRKKSTRFDRTGGWEPSDSAMIESRQKQAQNAARSQVAHSRPVTPMPLWKRALDLAGAGIGLILLFPVFLIISIYIKIVSPGPVFFKQDRIGYLGRPFTIWKFRTMHVRAEVDCHQAHLKDLIQNDNTVMKKLDHCDPRIIPFAKLLRATGLDELPQLINVLRGEMSLVGPRPCMDYEAAEYCVWQHERFDSKPGLTGLWQVNGKNRTSFLEMMRFDARYAKTQSFFKDLGIIFMTIPALFVQVLDGMPKRGKK